MKKVTINQFHPIAVSNDAITNSMFLYRDYLRKSGFNSNIYAEVIEESINDEVIAVNDYEFGNEDYLFLHHSLGYSGLAKLLKGQEKKFLLYHNITPYYYFPFWSEQYYKALLGRKQLCQMLSSMHGAICVSRYNAEELLALGYANVFTCPLLFNVEKISKENRAACSKKEFIILFTGRVVKNKCQHDLIKVLFFLRKFVDFPVRLVCVGGIDDYYYADILWLLRRLNLENFVEFTGKISQQSLYSWYRSADLFLCMSEHEGFCVPLIEAMCFDMPVIAYQSSAIAETLDGAGIMVTEKSHQEIAALIAVIAKDQQLKNNIIAQQRKRLGVLTLHKLHVKLNEIIAKIIN